MEQVTTDNELVVTFTSSNSEEEASEEEVQVSDLTMRQLDEEKPSQQFIDADVFGSDSSDSSEEESPKKFKCCTRCDHSDPPSSDDDCDSYDEDNGDGSDLVHTHKQNEQTPHDSEGEIPHEFKILLDHLTQDQR